MVLAINYTKNYKKFIICKTLMLLYISHFFLTDLSVYVK